MGHHIGVGRIGLLAYSAQFLERILRTVDRVGGARYATAGHHLDLVGAIADLLARRTPHFTHAIRDRAEHAQPGASADHGFHANRPRVAMSTRLRDGLACDEQARPLKVALLDRLHQPVIRACGVAHRCEAALQHPFHDVLALRRNQ